MLLILSLFLLICLNRPDSCYGRFDDDTEQINTSFQNSIQFLHYFDGRNCAIKVGDEFVNATAKVEAPFKLPTCLKEFYKMSHLTGCGKPAYNRFRYCAMAYHFENKKYSEVDFKQIWKKEKRVLVLIDGCLSCPRWPDRSTNISIKLTSRFKMADGTDVTQTRSDRFSDFKIGAVFKVELPNQPQRQLQPRLEIYHTCNQYALNQKKILRLPVLIPDALNQLTFESVNTAIYLPQGRDVEYTDDLLF